MKLRGLVEDLVQKKGNEWFPHLYIVDKQTGPYRSIQEAIEAAEPCSLIKISEGFYHQTLIITKPLRLQPKNQGTQEKIGVVLLALSGIAIHIKLPPESQQTCQISGIKVSHSGYSEDTIKKDLLEHQQILSVFSQKEKINRLESQFINRTAFQKIQNIVLLLERGKVVIKNCIFSLTYLVKSCSSLLPAIWVQRDGEMRMKDCQIKGHGTKQTIGIVNKMGVLHVQNCLISNHTEGGLLAWGIKNNPSSVIKNVFEKNVVGIHVVGEQFTMKIISNEIRNNTTGIKVGLASQPQINHNMITENEEGIEVYSAFPIISLNRIEKNKNNGVVCRTYKGFLCQAHLTKNIGIVGNGCNGILIEGQNNRTVVRDNYLIGYNKEAGVRVCAGANALLTHNTVHKNYAEGILIEEESNAVVEHNEITHNILCNVAMGGAQSQHTLLTQNIITHSPGAGINVIRSGRSLISRNDIMDNREGVVISNAQVHLRKNHIALNKNNGIVVEDMSSPLIVDNFITKNYGIGVFFRESNKATVHSNIVVSNQIDIGMEYANQTFKQQIKFSNTIDGPIYHPSSLQCLLI